MNNFIDPRWGNSRKYNPRWRANSLLRSYIPSLQHRPFFLIHCKIQSMSVTALGVCFWVFSPVVCVCSLSSWRRESEVCEFYIRTRYSSLPSPKKVLPVGADTHTHTHRLLAVVTVCLGSSMIWCSLQSAVVLFLYIDAIREKGFLFWRRWLQFGVQP